MKCKDCKHFIPRQEGKDVDLGTNKCTLFNIRGLQLFFEGYLDYCPLIDNECNLTIEGKKKLLEDRI